LAKSFEGTRLAGLIVGLAEQFQRPLQAGGSGVGLAPWTGHLCVAGGCGLVARAMICSTIAVLASA
jgi:hypothetical protein